MSDVDTPGKEFLLENGNKEKARDSLSQWYNLMMHLQYIKHYKVERCCSCKLEKTLWVKIQNLSGLGQRRRITAANAVCFPNKQLINPTHPLAQEPTAFSVSLVLGETGSSVQGRQMRPCLKVRYPNLAVAFSVHQSVIPRGETVGLRQTDVVYFSFCGI